MITSLSELNPVTVAGILARAALALHNEDNPAAAPAIPEERALREAVIAKARELAGIEPGDESERAREVLGDILDSQRENLIGVTDSRGALLRLATKGDLPSDLYNIDINPNMEQTFGQRFAREKELIEASIRSPDRELHCQPSGNPENPFLVSLFAKRFPHDRLARSFIMLVVANRIGLTLHVHQAWRLYPDVVDLQETSDLIDMLKRFLRVFGVDIEMEGQHGRLILLADSPGGKPIQNLIKVRNPAIRGQRQTTITLSYFWAPANRNQAAFVVGVDQTKYMKMLRSRGG
jgi:hypothetical protein